MITIDHNHHPSSPQNSKHNNIIHDHKILDWNDINPAGDGTDFLSSALGVDPIDINPDSLDDDFSSFINETSLASRPATPVKPTEGIEDISPLGDRSSSLSPPPDTVSPAPVTGTTLAGEENEEGESGEPQREEEEEDEEENVNGATASKDENQEHEGKKEEEQQQFLSTTDSLGSPLSELSPPPDQDDDEPAQPEQEEEPQTSPSTRPQETNKVSKPESTKSLSTTVAQPASGVSGSSGDATSSTASKNGLPASNAVTPMAGSSSNMGAMSGLSTSNQFPHPRVDGMQSMQGSVPHPAGPSTTDARVTTILELNNELFKIGAEFQAKGLIPGDERWTQFSTRMQSNLTWLAASADQRNTVASLPIMAPPPPVDFYSMERILQIYAELPRLFAKDIARRQTSQHAPSSAGPLMGMGLGAGAPTTPVHPVTPSLKRDRPVDDVQGAGDMNALKRRNTGSAMDGAMMPPPSTSPTNPRPPSAASNHSQPPNSVSISSPLSAGPGSTGHTSPPSSSNGLPGSISAPGSFPRSTPTPAPGQTPSAPHSSSTSPRQQTPSLSGLSGHELAEAQAAANNRERVRQQQIREAQMRAHQQAQQQAQQQAHAREQQAREAQQKQQMAARQMSGTPAGMSMNGMPGAHNPAGASSIGSGLAPSEIQRQLLTVLQTPNHPMVLYMHRMDPNFGNLPIQTQMQKMWATQNMMKQQQQQRQNQQNQQGFPNPGGNPNPMSQMSSPPNPHAQQKPSGLGQNSFPSIGVTPSSPAPPQSPAIPQLAGGGGMNMFGLDSPANQNAAGGQGAGGGIDPRLLPPGMNINNMTPLQRQQLLMMQQQQQAARGGSGTPNPMGMGMGGAGPGGMGGPSGMGGLGGGMGGNTQNMMSMMNPQQQMMQQQQQEQRMREQRQQQQQMAMGMGMPSRDGGVNPGLMAGPSIARSARSPSDTVPNPMTPRMPQQHLAPGTGMSRPPTSEEYSRLMQQQAAQAAQAQRVLSARSPSNFNPQQAGGAGPGGWQGQQQQGMNMGMNIGGGGMGMGMGMNPQQQQNAGAGYGMSPPGSAGGMYTGASSPTGGNQGPMWSSTANVDHASQMRHMSGTPGPQQPQNMGPSMMDSSIPSELDLFSSWTQ